MDIEKRNSLPDAIVIGKVRDPQVPSESLSPSKVSPIDARQDILLPIPRGLSWRKKLRLAVLQLETLACTLWFEVHSFSHRIRLIPPKTESLPIKRFSYTPALQNLPVGISRFSCTDDMRRLTTRFPWASLSDVFLYQEGWEAGVLSCLRNLVPCTLQTDTEKPQDKPYSTP